jgi:polysaccharide export outer membrane protein
MNLKSAIRYLIAGWKCPAILGGSMTKITAFAIAFLIGISLASAASAGAKTGPAAAPAASASAGQDQAVRSESNRPLQQRNPRYQVQASDILSLTFPLSTELNQTVTVQPDGFVTLLGAGDLYIQGMTVPEIAEALKRSYVKILHDPIINVGLMDFQKPYFIVSGLVAKPGQFELRYDTTVSEGIALAGGLTKDGKTQIFLFHRDSSGWIEVKKVTLGDVLHGKNVNEDMRLHSGDMVYVPEKFISKFRTYVPYTLGLYANPATIAF